MIEDKIDQATSYEELKKLQLDVINVSKLQIKEDPNCLDSRGRTPVQRQYIVKRFELTTGIKIEEQK